MKLSCKVNGAKVEADVPPRLLLSDFLRHELELTGTNVGCEMGVCGACTVIVNDEPVRSCLMFAIQADGARVRTDRQRPSAGGRPACLRPQWLDRRGSRRAAATSS